MQNNFGFKKAVVQDVGWNVPNNLIVARFDKKVSTTDTSIIAKTLRSLTSAINDAAFDSVDAILIKDLGINWSAIVEAFSENTVRHIVFQPSKKNYNLRFFGYKSAMGVSEEQFIDILKDHAKGKDLIVTYNLSEDPYVKISKNKSK